MQKIFVAAILLLTSPAFGNVQGIGNAVVDDGVTTLSWRNSYNSDDPSNALNERWQTRLMADHGLTDDLALGAYVQGDRRAHDNLELDSAMAELRYELTGMKTHPFYSGFRLRYFLRDGSKGSDMAHVRFIIGRSAGKWDARYNQIVSHEIGPQATGGLLFDTRVQATYGYAENHRAGLEAFLDFGHASRTDFREQTHTLGPVFTGWIDEDISYEAGYRTALSESAPQHTVKFFISRRF